MCPELGVGPRDPDDNVMVASARSKPALKYECAFEAALAAGGGGQGRGHDRRMPEAPVAVRA